MTKVPERQRDIARAMLRPIRPPTFLKEGDKIVEIDIVDSWKRDIAEHVTVDPASGCWLYNAPSKNSDGYVQTTALIVGRVFAHRLSYLAHVGNIPRGALVLQSNGCSSRTSVNAQHGRLGTHRENMNEMVKAGHAGNAKVTPE